ncbi:MAG: 4Fe-4S dicluster domain-containing protein [Candidatus Lokiarchaeota archaeon]|nr:4Fe-4S dicluster domain-containing protein [Candidatus Lokiarchaeota archaeon]
MTLNSYEKLREFLDQFPIGFRKTQSGVEIKILKRLFTEEEAELTTFLTIRPERARTIARRTNKSLSEIEEKLELMAKKGLIFRTHRENHTLYNAAPFMIGLYEYSVKKIDKELAQLFKEYYHTAGLEEIGASNIPGFKVIPLEETIQSDTTLYPYQMLEESIKHARKIAVTDCVCRKESQLLGEGCNHPMETCLSFGVAAEYYIENGLGREITSEEAIQIIKETDEAGLVHAGANSKHLSNICNCCPCCCVSMKGMTQYGQDRQKFMNAIFESIIDRDLCIACGSCVERCPVNAISLNEVAEVDRNLCLGCGLCSNVCPEEAIHLKPRKDLEEPFDRVLDMGIAILEGKRKTSRD